MREETNEKHHVGGPPLGPIVAEQIEHAACNERRIVKKKKKWALTVDVMESVQCGRFFGRVAEVIPEVAVDQELSTQGGDCDAADSEREAKQPLE